MKEKTISQRLNENINFTNAIHVLYEMKSEKKVFRKAAEELLELATNILKELNSPGKIPPGAMAEEIVDVAMHLELLQKYFDSVYIGRVCGDKISKMLNSKDFKKYLNKYAKQSSSLPLSSIAELARPSV